MKADCSAFAILGCAVHAVRGFSDISPHLTQSLSVRVLLMKVGAFAVELIEEVR